MSDKEKKLVLDIFKFGKKQLFLKAIGNFAFFILLLLILWLSVTLADNLFYFSTMTRWGLWFIHNVFIVFLLLKYLVAPWYSFLMLKQDSNLTAITSKISKIFPELKDSLTNTYHLITLTQANAISNSLKVAAVKKYLDQFKNYDFQKRLRLKDYLPSFKMAIPIIISAVILVGFKFDDITHSTLRLLNPTNEYLKIPQFTFQVDPGDAEVVKGESINFIITYRGPSLSAGNLLIWPLQNENEGQSIPLEYKDGLLTANYADIRESFYYQVIGTPLNAKQLKNSIRSQQFQVNVLIPPMIKNLDISLTPPAYSGLEPQFLDRNIGDILALAGTNVKIKAEVNKIIDSAYIQFGQGNQSALKIQGFRISTDFSIQNDESYKIILIDSSGLANLNPIEYRITTLPDAPPFIEIIDPGQDIEGQLDATIALNIDAFDDYGLLQIYLYYKFLRSSQSASDTTWQRISIPLQSTKLKRQELSYLWDFNKLPLAFDDGIIYYAKAIDNNRITGPGIGISKIYYIRFPSLEELFDSFTEKENEQVEKVEEVAEQSENLKKELEKINRELKRADQIEWEQKQQIEKALEKQKEMQEQIEKIQKNLEELINQLDSNNLISEEVLEKYMQLQELFRELASPELMEAMEKLQQSLDKADPKQVKQALQDFKLNQEAFQKKIERTMELLKQVQLEQKMDQLVQKAKDLLEQQKDISEKVSSDRTINQEEFDQLEEQQKQQTNKMQNIKEDLENLMKEPRLSKFEDTQKSLESAMEQLTNSELQKQVQDLQSALTSKNQPMSGKMSQQLQKNFDQLQQSLSNAQSQMLNQNKKDIQKKMLSALQRLLELSHNQERIQSKTQKSSPLSDEFKDISVSQGRMMQNFQKLVAELIQLSKETFFIQPGMSKSLGKSQGGMAKSLNELSERNKAQAERYQAEALGGLNESIMQMQQSMSQLAQSESGTGFEQFMEQMQQMAGSQGQLNQQTLNLFQGQGNSGQLSMQQQGEMQRLASQQAALREAIEKMSEQMGSRQDVMGRIGELAGQMDEVVQDLLKQNVSRETINRQRQILSRLLDAQKSVREREFSKKRKAELAKEYKIINPGDLKNLTDLEKKKLQDALKRSLNEGYQRDYQKIIEAYFKMLIQSQTEKN